MQYLGEIEEHLGITIDLVSVDLKVQMNEFDGKVVYGQKLKKAGTHCGQPSSLGGGGWERGARTFRQIFFLRV